jgi:HSP20 family protein
MFGYLSGFDNDLWNELDRMRRQMDDLYRGWPGTTGIRSAVPGTYPPVNVGVSPEHVDVYVFAAGLDSKAFDVSLQENLLTIAGERVAGLPDDVEFYRQERFAGAFRRVITLPDDVDADKVEATYRDGVLHISVRRRETARARRIEVV